MKKLFAIISLFALVLTSCEKEETIVIGSNFDTITATIESAADTKATLEQESTTVSVKWADGDAISVFYQTASEVINVKYNLTSGKGTTTGSFTKDENENADLNGATMLAAAYPYTQGANCDANTAEITGMTAAVDKYPMAYKGNSQQISFKNAGALVQVNTANIPDGFEKLVLSSATKGIAGAYTITFNNQDEPFAKKNNDDTKSLEISTGNLTNETIYFPLFIDNYTDLTVKAINTTNSTEYSLVAPKALATSRNNIYYTSALAIATNTNELKQIIASTASDITIIVDESINNIELPNSTDKTITLVINNITDDISVEAQRDKTVSGKINLVFATRTVTDKTLTINLPDATVEASGNATFANIYSTTASNTLILGAGITATKVTVKQGNIQVNEGATLNGVELSTEQGAATSVTVIDNGGTIDNVTSSENITVVSSPSEYRLVNAIQAVDANGTVTLTEDVDLTAQLVISKNITLDLKGYTIKNTTDIWKNTEEIDSWSLISVQGDNVKVTIKGNGSVIAKENDCFAIDVRNGAEVTLQNGVFSGNISAVYAYFGSAIIEGGEYKIQQLSNITNDHRYLLNIYGNTNGSIKVTGGKFYNFDPAKSNGENPVANFVPAGYSSIADSEGNYTVNEGIFNEMALNAALNSSLAEITLADNIDLDNSISVTRDVKINLGSKYIKCKTSDVFVVTAGTLTIDGPGEVWGSEDNTNSSCAVWAKENGKVIINGGTYKVGDDTSNGQTGNWRNDCIYAKENASIEINGGEFQYTGNNPDGHKYLVNSKDNNPTQIQIKGGKFYKYNPAQSLSESPTANFVAAGYSAIEDGDWYIVEEGIYNMVAFKTALNANISNNVINLKADLTGDVTITQKADVNITIEGNNNKFTGVMTVYGKGRQSGSETLKIKDLNFVAKEGAASCIVSPDRSINNAYSYSHNVTVENCTFTDPDGTVDCAAVRHEDGGDKNWILKGCTVDNTMHSILQVNNVEGKLTIDDCTVSSKNGASLNSCTNVEMNKCNFDVKGYALRFGVSSGGNLGETKTYTIADSSLKSACNDGDAVIIFRASAVDATLTFTNSTVTGTTKIKGNTDSTTIIGTY